MGKGPLPATPRQAESSVPLEEVSGGVVSFHLPWEPGRTPASHALGFP